MPALVTEDANMTGHICSLVLQKGFGFLRLSKEDAAQVAIPVDPAGRRRDLFFHFSALDGDLCWDESLLHLECEFTVVDGGEKGPRAEAVRKAES